MKVGIAGLGLIGGSLAKAYEKSGAAVYGYDGNRVVQDYAKLQGTLTGDLDRETIGDCDLLLVALYPQVSIDYLKDMAPYISKDTLVMDCCGVKRESAGWASPWRRSTASPLWAATPWRAPSTPALPTARPTCFRGRPWWSSPESGTTSCCWTG